MTMKNTDSEMYNIIVEFLRMENDQLSDPIDAKVLAECVDECFDYAVNKQIEKYFEVKYVFSQCYTAKYNFRFLATAKFWGLKKDEQKQHILRMWKYNELEKKEKEWVVCDLQCMCIEYMEFKYGCRFRQIKNNK